MRAPVAVIQARMGSSRLPGKVLMDLGGVPMLARIIERLGAARRLSGIVVATPVGEQDEPVRALARSLGVATFAGSEDDVLSRYAGAAAHFGGDPIVRLTADCPFIDPEVVDHCIETFFDTPRCDHLGLGGAFPDGLDTEVMSRAALERADREARLPSEREHVTPYLWKHPERFVCRTADLPIAAGGYRWTVDEPRDLEFVRAVFSRLYRPGQVFGWRDVIDLLLREPALAAINADIERNAGYRRSLDRDAEAR